MFSVKLWYVKALVCNFVFKYLLKKKKKILQILFKGNGEPIRIDNAL
jgi:hypothetical protein